MFIFVKHSMAEIDLHRHETPLSGVIRVRTYPKLRHGEEKVAVERTVRSGALELPASHRRRKRPAVRQGPTGRPQVLRSEAEGNPPRTKAAEASSENKLMPEMSHTV